MTLFSSQEWGQLMQLVSISFKGVLICMIIRQLSNMRYPLYDSIVTRIRYLYQIALFNFTATTIVPDEDLNEGYHYLEENRHYKWITVVLATQVISIFALMQDLHSGNYETKSSLWWISSPSQSFSVALGLFYLFDKIRRLSNENKLLKAQMGMFSKNY